jgi:hypothetical protein
MSKEDWNITSSSAEDFAPLLGVGNFRQLGGTDQLMSYGYLAQGVSDSSDNHSEVMTGLNRTNPTNVSLELRLLCGTDPDWQEIHTYR